MIDVISEAAESVGGLVKLAEAIGIRHQSFYSWKHVPAERVLEIERVSGVARERLRPDLYPRERSEASTPTPQHTDTPTPAEAAA